MSAEADPSQMPRDSHARSGPEEPAPRPAKPKTTALSKSYKLVDGKRMAFHERGQGAAIVFLHGNPTSSYLWRNVVPYLADHGRCIVPDLIGMGDSEKLEDAGSASYGFPEHRHYLQGLLDQLDLGDGVTIVGHDWGGLLGFDWARRHRDQVAGIAYSETFVAPLRWDEFPEIGRPIFQAMRSDQGEGLVLENNVFVEAVLPSGVMRELTDEEKAEYRRPFATSGEDRRPTLSWPRQLPFSRDPDELVHPDADEVLDIVEACGQWLAGSELPKLFISLDPGCNLVGQAAEFCRRWPNQVEVSLAGIHYIQEDSPDLLGTAVSGWLAGVRGGGGAGEQAAGDWTGRGSAVKRDMRGGRA
jgi:haloalkane dehalogenase